MVFYASTFPYDSNSDYRYTIVASSVEAVDEWYRLTKDNGHELHRHAPDFYTHVYGHYPWRQLESSTNQALKEKLRFTINNAREGATRGEYSWPGQLAPDHISGKAFYIRSKSDPSIFWYDNDGFIVASKTERTKFRITGKTRPEENHVMIPSDVISIQVLGKDSGYVRNDGGIVFSDGSGSDTFLFSDFKTSFLPAGSKGDVVMKKVERDGDEWELVA